MDDHYLATLSVYQWVIGQAIDFHLTWPTHPRFTVEHDEGQVALTAATGERQVFVPGDLDKTRLIDDARRFILAHADTRGLKRGKHTTWSGAEWCKRVPGQQSS